MRESTTDAPSVVQSAMGSEVTSESTVPNSSALSVTIFKIPLHARSPDVPHTTLEHLLQQVQQHANDEAVEGLREENMELSGGRAAEEVRKDAETLRPELDGTFHQRFEVEKQWNSKEKLAEDRTHARVNRRRESALGGEGETQTSPPVFGTLGGNKHSDSLAWKNSVGDLGDWGYINTDGLGLYEWVGSLQFSPSLGSMGPIMAVLAAAMRSAMGHPAPFALKYIEIGNEDFFASSSYDSYRWADFYNALVAQFPQLTYIATSATSGVGARIGANLQLMICSSFSSDTALTYPFIDGSVGDDIVFAASYAPLLNHISSSQWSPNLITFSPNTVVLSTSYYIQQAVNTATTSNTIVFSLPFGTISAAGTGTVLTAASGTMNTPTNPNAAVPESFTFTAGKTITYVTPALSASVLIVSAH
ncbi:hypothetical protein B0H11DRAFT_2250544 [Mycena galericulata]|nr:hypothetical protein B0H11DRAFT_2250544 [Mycena galericulata]